MLSLKECAEQVTLSVLWAQLHCSSMWYGEKTAQLGPVCLLYQQLFAGQWLQSVFQLHIK